MRKIVHLLALIVLFTAVCCQRKDLLEPHEHYNLIIRANFDSLGRAQLLTNKNDYTAPGTPRSTKYVLYEKSSGLAMYAGSFHGVEGKLLVEEGVYDLLVYTSDFNEYDANFFRGMDRSETAETYTRQSAIEDIEPRGNMVEMYMVEPDPTFAVLKKDVAVLNNYENNLVEVEMVQKSFKYYLTVKAIGLHTIHTATMNISGMYTSAYLAHEEHRMNESGTQSVDMDIHYDTNPDPEIDNGFIYGEFWSFGPNQRKDIVNSITFYFINGNVIVRKLDDLTSQIKTLDRGGEIIVEQVLEVKGPGGGFQPSVGDWNQTDVDLIL